MLICFRGTKNFVIGLSMDNVEFTNVVEGMLTDPIDKGCNEIPVEEFTLESPTAGKYLKFTALNFYPRATAGSALQFLGWE